MVGKYPLIIYITLHYMNRARFHSSCSGLRAIFWIYFFGKGKGGKIREEKRREEALGIYIHT